MAFEVVLSDGCREPLEATEQIEAIGEMKSRHGIKGAVTFSNCDTAGVWGLLEVGVVSGGGKETDILRWPRRPTTFPQKE